MRLPSLQFVRTCSVCVLVFVAVFAAAQPTNAADKTPRVSYAGHSVVRAVVNDEAQLAQLLEICPTVYSCHIGVGSVDVVADARQKKQLRRAGIVFEVRIEDLQPIIRAERQRIAAAQEGGIAGGSFFDEFKTYDQIMAQLDVLAGANPPIAQVTTIGTSIEGRAIKAIRISGSLDAKPGFVITGCQHAREWISPMTAMYIANHLIFSYESDPEVAALLDSLEIYIIPVVNPDGYNWSWGPDRLWRKNRRPNGDGTTGVDLNRNWAIGFGGESTSSSPSSDLYPGTAPFSEPETTAVSNFVIAHPNIITSLDLHAYGQLVLQPWGYTNDIPPAYDCINHVGGQISQSILDVHGMHYPHGSGNGVIYLAGGTIHDWMFGNQDLMAYLIELRPDDGNPGFILPPEEIIPTGEEVVPAVLALAKASLNPVYLAFHLGEPEFVQADQSNVVQFATLPLSSGPITPGSERLFARVGTSGPFAETSLTSIGDLNFEALLPPAPCNQVIQYYFQFTSSELGAVTVPADAPSNVYEVAAQNIALAFEDDMETDTGWTVGAPGDDATTGVWTRVAPNQTVNGSGVPAQPGFDNPDGAGTLCWITGADAGPFSGSNDVDGGTTTLTSPALDASGEGEAHLSYFRWYSNNTGSNPNTETMLVEISNNDGASWTLLEDVAFNETTWTRRSFRIADFVEPTNQVRVRFIARDLTSNGGAIVEAGVDDVQVVLTSCDAQPCFADLVDSGTFQPPGDGQVDGADLGFLLVAWGANPGSPADLVDGGTFQPPPDGQVDGADLAAMLTSWGSCE